MSQGHTVRLRSNETGIAYGLSEFAALAQLRTDLEAGDFAMVIEMLRTEGTKQLTRFAEQSAVGDFEGIRRTAHNLAGLFGQFGATEASCLAQVISYGTTMAEHHALHHTLLVSCRRAIDGISRIT